MNRVNRLESNSDAEDEPEDDTDKIIKKYKRVMLFCLSYVMLAEGIVLGLNGPTLTEMTVKLQVPYDVLSRAYAVKGLGQMVATPLAGVIADKYRSDLVIIMAANLALLALVITCIPFSSTVWMLGILIMVQGFLFSTSMTGAYAYTASLWKENYGQILSFSMALVFIGKMIPSPLVLPFLSSYENSTFMDVGSRMPSQEHNTEHKHMKEFEYEGRILYPFLICALIIFGAAIPMAITYFIFRDKRLELWSLVQPPAEKTDSNNRTGNACYAVLVTFCLAFLCMITIIPFHGSGDYFFSISLSKELRMSKESAGILSAVNQIVALFGNLATIIVLHFVSTAVYFNMALFITMITLTVATLYGLKSEIVFWITTCLFSFIHLSTMCTFSAYVKNFISPTGTTLGLTQIGFGLGRILMNTVTGTLFQKYGSRMVLLEFTTAIGLGLLMSLFLCIVKKVCRTKTDASDTNNDDIRHPLFQSDEE